MKLLRIIGWLERRTGIDSAVRSFLYEEIPASSGWRQIFGSVAVFGFLLQVFTGILLAFNYAPTPGDAWFSLRYIVTEITGGAIVRGLHHWGASMMIIVVVLHMIQVFIWGAYKRPREATWVVGVVLLLIVMAFGLTGYLLPWDNRAYWGTVVTTQIAASAPFAGPWLSRLLGGEGSVGVVTFARFYAAHVLLLPPVTILIIGFHIYLVRRHGVAPVADESAPKKKFFPEQVFRDTVAVFGYFLILVALAMTVSVPLGHLADPTDTTFTPRPEWYFLFLFQLLKLFTGPLEIVGSVVLPTLAILLLLLIPFIDRAKAIRATRRFTAIGAVALAGTGWCALTLAALRGTPGGSETSEVASAAKDGAIWHELSPEEIAGLGYFRQQKCETCHAMKPGGSTIGPDLTHIPEHHKNAAWMITHFRHPDEVMPGSIMPAVNLPDAQLNALSAFLLKLTPANAVGLTATPANIVSGAMIYQSSDCGTCHRVNGEGTQLGPDLDGVGSRRTAEWIQAHFRDPAKMSPGSPMPHFDFDATQMDAITRYLMALPKR